LRQFSFGCGWPRCDLLRQFSFGCGSPRWEIRGSIPLVAAGRAGHFGPFCGKSMEVPFLEQLTRQPAFSAAKPGQTQSNPVKPFFWFDQEQARPNS